MDSIEPTRLRVSLKEINLRKLSNARKTSTMYLYSCAHSVVRSKEILRFVAPKLKHDLASIERLYWGSCLQMFNFCNMTYDTVETKVDMLLLLHVFDEFCFIKRSKKVDPALAKHLQSGLLNRLISSSQMFESDRSKKLNLTSHCLVLMICLDFLDSFEENHFQPIPIELSQISFGRYCGMGSRLRWTLTACAWRLRFTIEETIRWLEWWNVNTSRFYDSKAMQSLSIPPIIATEP